jgi:hypothetical protein
VSDNWVLTISYQARMDLFTFPWREDVEIGGVLTGRFERPGITPVDTGRDLFIRRVFPSDFDRDRDSVGIDYGAIHHLQTVVPSVWHGSSSGRYGKDDPGTIIGDIHSHVGFDVTGDYHRQLSDADRTRAAVLALAPSPVPGRPWLSTVASAGLRWEAGEPEEDWDDDVRLDHFLVFGDERVVRPTVILQSECEWEVEELQRQLLATGGD